MKYEVARTLHDLQCLAREWNTLLRSSGSNSIFLTWQWLESWLEIETPDPRLLVISVRDGAGRLVGLAPLYVAAYRLLDVVPYRILHAAGDTNCGAEYQTWIAKAGDEPRVFGCIAGALADLDAEWDLIWLPRLGAWSAAHAPLVAALHAAGFAVNSRPSVFSSFPLPESFDAYLARLSANRRQQIRRMTRRILDQPSVEVRRVRTADELGPALEALFDLHAKRWRAAGEDGVFVRRPKEKAFYERFASRALEQSWLALYLLLADGEPKAAQIGYVYDGAFLQLQEGFDPEFSSHAGNVLRAAVIEDCIACGLREYDFLGGITDHKRRWLAEERLGADVLAAAPHARNLPVMRGGVWPTGAYLRPRRMRSAAAAPAAISR